MPLVVRVRVTNTYRVAVLLRTYTVETRESRVPDHHHERQWLYCTSTSTSTSTSTCSCERQGAKASRHDRQQQQPLASASYQPQPLATAQQASLSSRDSCNIYYKYKHPTHLPAPHYIKKLFVFNRTSLRLGPTNASSVRRCFDHQFEKQFGS
jgi:hypothetical protein